MHKPEMFSLPRMLIACGALLRETTQGEQGRVHPFDKASHYLLTCNAEPRR